MVDKSSLSEAERANLVAYLDGELDEETAQALEAKLLLDGRAREEAGALQWAWDLLDYLPRAEPSPTFTNRTVERIAAPRTHLALPGKPGRRRCLTLGLAWAAAVLVAAGVGFAGAQLVSRWTDLDRHLIRDLRVIENKRLYETVEDLDFLRQLDHPDLFGDDTSGG
jgi:anti-sigma factor RsiW